MTELPTLGILTLEEPDCVCGDGHLWQRLPIIGTEMCSSCGTNRWLDYGTPPEWVYEPGARRKWVRDRLGSLDADDLHEVERHGWQGIGMDRVTRWWACFDGARILVWRADEHAARRWLDQRAEQTEVW